MSRIKLVLNSQHTEPWLEPIGKLVLNFSAIELQTYLWLSDLSPEERVPDEQLYARFKTRVKAITSCLSARTIDATLKTKCLDAWDNAVDVARRRNTILHNPLIYGWRTADESGPPDTMCIADVAHLGSKPPVTKQALTLVDLNKLVNSTSSLASLLFLLRSQVRGV